ncbi:MAG: formylmethanofuran dehydrogenase subunit E family protein [bacterium]|nr:formylmethanofuran dehydrogenase subunit E family protein [bacterium]
MSSEIEYIKRFHGKLDLYILIGFKMGLYALELLKCDLYWDLKIEVEFGRKTPQSYIIDGLQLSTGCTYGKGNITALSSDSKKATFQFKEHICEIKIRSEVIDKISSLKDSEKIALEFYDSEPSQLFEMKLFSNKK